MMRANQGIVSLRCSSESSWIFPDRTLGWSDCIEHKRGIDYSLTTDFVLFAAEEGREKRRKLDVGCKRSTWEIWIWYFASRTLLWNSWVDKRQCNTCVLTSSKYMPLMLQIPSGVCYTAVCLQVAGPRPVVLGNIRFEGFIGCVQQNLTTHPHEI